jgi:DNA adenine methylase
MSVVNQADKIECKPFVKWVGGKSQLRLDLLSRLPASFVRYFEPFLGGGALFFALQPSKAYLSDINLDLINTYRAIQNNVSELIEDLKQHRYDKDYYYKIRSIDRTLDYLEWTDIQKAGRLIYLNKSCFNGLYRVNSKGYFNVPMGSYNNPKILDEENLLACSKVLKKCNISIHPFLEIEDILDKDDFVYFDPPYAPLNTTSNFTSYTQDGFGSEMQIELRDFCNRLTDRGVKFMLSNSSAPLILELYEKYHIEFIYASRAINSKGEKRGKIPEVIVRNYIN